MRSFATVLSDLGVRQRLGRTEWQVSGSRVRNSSIWEWLRVRLSGLLHNALLPVESVQHRDLRSYSAGKRAMGLGPVAVCRIDGIVLRRDHCGISDRQVFLSVLRRIHASVCDCHCAARRRGFSGRKIDVANLYGKEDRMWLWVVGGLLFG